MPLYTPGRRRAILLLLLTSVLLLTLDLRGNAIFDAVRTGFNKFMDPLESAADVATRPIRNAWHGIMDYQDRSRTRTSALQDQLDAQRGDQIAAQAAIQDYQALLATNDLPALGDYPTVTAMVVGEQPEQPRPDRRDQQGPQGRPRRSAWPSPPAPGSSARSRRRCSRTGRDVMLITDPRYVRAGEGRAGRRRRSRRPRRPSRRRPSRAASAPPASVPAHGAAESAPDVRAAADGALPPETVPGETTPPRVDDHDDDHRSPSIERPRDTGKFSGQGAESLPQVDLLEDTPMFGRIVVGDLIFTAGGNDSLAPPDIPIGVVRNVINRSSSAGPLLEVQPSVDLDRLHFVSIIIYRSSSEAGTSGHLGGGRLMLASLVQGPLLRLFLAGVVLLAFQRTLFEDIRPAGVTLQVLLALAAAAGAVAGPQKGALAGFVLGLLYDLNVGTPLGSSSIAMGLGGYVAGYAISITVRPPWWLAAIFTGLGAAVGEAVVPLIRAVHRRGATRSSPATASSSPSSASGPR